jgi:cytochrome c biogenesis protein CcmG/thiol:disulfide interchange protein DsbE
MIKINFNLFLLFFVFSNFLFAQTSYYKMPDGVILNEDNFTIQKANMLETGNVNVDVEGGITRNDSIIKEVRLTYLNPFTKHKKKIGTAFKIQIFKNKEGKNYNENYLKGKPSLITFWSINCSPCIKEFPDLNRIQQEFKKAVNFVAITIDSRSEVENFLKNHKFEFEQITDSMFQLLNELKINALPMSIVLDKNGTILNVYGGLITDNEKEVIETLKNSL